LPSGENPLADALREGFDTFQQARDRKRAETLQNAQIADQRQRNEDAHLASETAAYGAGVRSGTAPAETGTDVTIPAMPDLSPPTTADFARRLRGGPSEPAAPESTAPFTPPTGDAWSRAIRGNGMPAPAPQLVAAALAPQGAPVAPTVAGAFNPQTGTFGGGPPSPGALALGQAVARTVHLGPTGRYAQLDATHYIDQQPARDAAALARQQHQEDQMTPVMVSQMLAQQERDRKKAAYIAAGIPEARAQLFVDNPALAENDPTIGKRPPALPKDERLQTRIQELVKGGVPLAKASAQARTEFGETDPTAVHEANRRFDVDHPIALDVAEADHCDGRYRVENQLLRRPGLHTA